MFTGVSDAYEAPSQPDLTIDTSVLSVDEAVRRLLQAIGGEPSV